MSALIPINKALSELAAHRGFKLTRVGVVFDGELTFEQWLGLMRGLAAVDAASPWCIGDGLNQGEAKYGEKYKKALSIFDYEPGTLRDIAWVAAHVGLSVRTDKLSWTHHRLVAAHTKDTKEQRGLLELALEKEWSVADLREHIRQEEAEESEKSEKPLHSFSFTKWISEGVRFFQSQLQSIEDLEPEQRQAMRQNMKPLIDIYNLL